MPRTELKTSRAGASRSGGSVPLFPEMAEQIKKAVPGLEEWEARIENWNRLMQRRWDTADHDRIRSVTVLEEELALANGYLEASWTLTVTAGQVVTGMRVFSASGENLQVSFVAFQADAFLINTATGGNKQIFSATASEVVFGDVLTVDLDDGELFIGDGLFDDANTPFFVDKLGRFSLKDVLSFDGTTFVISGTGTAGNYVAITDNGLQVGDDPTGGTIHLSNNSGVPYFNLRYNGDVYGTWSVSSTKSSMQLSDDSLHAVSIDGSGSIAVFGTAGQPGIVVSNDVLILGDLNTGAHSAIGAETVTGFLTIKDVTGVPRKIAVVS